MAGGESRDQPITRRQRLEAIDVAVRERDRNGFAGGTSLHEYVGIRDRCAGAVDHLDHERSGGSGFGSGGVD